MAQITILGGQSAEMLNRNGCHTEEHGLISDSDQPTGSERAHREVARGTGQLLVGKLVLLVAGFAVP
jgi:hypothetical protein